MISTITPKIFLDGYYLQRRLSILQKIIPTTSSKAEEVTFQFLRGIAHVTIAAELSIRAFHPSFRINQKLQLGCIFLPAILAYHAIDDGDGFLGNCSRKIISYCAPYHSTMVTLSKIVTLVSSAGFFAAGKIGYGLISALPLLQVRKIVGCTTFFELMDNALDILACGVAVVAGHYYFAALIGSWALINNIAFFFKLFSPLRKEIPITPNDQAHLIKTISNLPSPDDSTLTKVHTFGDVLAKMTSLQIDLRALPPFFTLFGFFPTLAREPIKEDLLGRDFSGYLYAKTLEDDRNHKEKEQLREARIRIEILYRLDSHIHELENGIFFGKINEMLSTSAISANKTDPLSQQVKRTISLPCLHEILDKLEGETGNINAKQIYDDLFPETKDTEDTSTATLWDSGLNRLEFFQQIRQNLISSIFPLLDEKLQKKFRKDIVLTIRKDVPLRSLLKELHSSFAPFRNTYSIMMNSKEGQSAFIRLAILGYIQGNISQQKEELQQSFEQLSPQKNTAISAILNRIFMHGIKDCVMFSDNLENFLNHLPPYDETFSSKDKLKLLEALT